MDLTTPMYGNQNEGLPETTKRNGISKRMPIVKTEAWSSKPERMNSVRPHEERVGGDKVQGMKSRKLFKYISLILN